MVMLWILNSISKDLVGSFFYATTAREHWLELGERYGESNRSMIYQIKRRIASILQENLSVMTYYNKFVISYRK
ncbi:hypothetical protein MANES_06G048501v8 [Manihot esculenta]|uniref:Uncharacterized protein n=1 Tax=Manihot esculenta TaxID=3983 RepID=A0ACB7HHE9_MANES|nr:hypothetical protein MANES_06G048501v8 [Manihot esculenta]